MKLELRLNRAMASHFRSLPRIFVADPALTDDLGHHFELTENILSGIEEIGLIGTCLCNANATNLCKSASRRYRPTFSVDLYSLARSSQAGATTDHESLMRNPPLTAEILHLVGAGILLPTDILYFHTADKYTFAALANLYFSASNSTLASLPFVVINTPYPEKIMPFSRYGKSLRCYLRQISSGMASGARVSLVCETELLAARLRRETGIEVGELKLPVSRVLYQSSVSAIGSPTIVSHLGNGRREKGFERLPKIISEVMKQRRPDSAEIHFYIQCSPQKIGYDPIVKRTIESLQSMSDGIQITLQKTNLSSSEYIQALRDTTILLLPYDVDAYRDRGSGLAVDGAASGCIIVSTAGTYPGEIAARQGGYACNDDSHFAKAIVEANENRQASVPHAQIAGRLFGADRCPTRYAKQLLDLVNSSSLVVNWPSVSPYWEPVIEGAARNA